MLQILKGFEALFVLHKKLYKVVQAVFPGLDVLIMFVLSRMNVEDANKKLKAEKGIAADEVTDASDIN